MLVLKEYKSVFQTLCSGLDLPVGVLHDTICIFLHVRGSCTGERIQSQIGGDLDMLLGLGRP